MSRRHVRRVIFVIFCDRATHSRIPRTFQLLRVCVQFVRFGARHRQRRVRHSIPGVFTRPILAGQQSGGHESPTTEPPPTAWHRVSADRRLLTLTDITPACPNAQLPAHVAHIGRQLEQLARCTATDLLVGLLYAVALESGFAAIGETPSSVASSESFEGLWRGGAFNARFVRAMADTLPATAFAAPQHQHQLYELPVHMFGLYRRYPCTLLVRDVGGCVCVSLNVVGSGEADTATTTTVPPLGYASAPHGVCVPVGVHVVSAQLQHVGRAVKNLELLERRLKDGLFTPVRQRLAQWERAPAASLAGVPEDARGELLAYLGWSDLQSVRQLCEAMRADVTEAAERRRKREAAAAARVKGIVE